MIEVIPFVQGPVETNSYLVADLLRGDAAVIDPAWDGGSFVRFADSRGWTIRQVLLTHAHFDHIAGTPEIFRNIQPAPSVALHPDDLYIWKQGGWASLFGFHIEPLPEPTIMLDNGQLLQIGEFDFEVRAVPGHTPGHVLFYSQEAGAAFCGDVIFAGSIGRTDLPGGNFHTLMQSIQTQVLTLPDETRLYCGHGPDTTVAEERSSNPFLTDIDF